MSASQLKTYADQLLAVCADAVATTSGGVIARRYVAHETPSLDCEMLCVSIGPLTLRSIQRAALDAGHAYELGSLNLLTFYVTVARDCYPVTDGTGSMNAPTPAQHDAAAGEAAQDVWAIWNAIEQRKADGTLFDGACRELYMDGATPKPVSGQIAGWLIVIRTAVDGYSPL